MTTLSYSHTRNNLASVLEKAESNREAIIVTRNGKKSSVILSMDEFESMQETLHLLSTPENARRMFRGLADYEAGNFVEGKLFEEE